MNSDVLMVNPPVLLGDVHIDSPLNTILGVVSNAAVLRDSKYNVSIADSFSQDGCGVSSAGDRIHIGSPVESLLELQGRAAPDRIIVAVSPFMYPQVRTDHCDSVLKETRTRFPGSSIIAADCNYSGMHYIEYDGMDFLSRYPLVDAVLKYECERCLPEFLSGEFHEKKRVLCDASEIEPDDLPLPAWDLISTEWYFQCQEKYRQFFNPQGSTFSSRSLPIITSRGCPFNCLFCTSNPGQAKRKWRANSPEYIHKLLACLSREYKLDAVVFLDSIPNFDEERFLEILEIVRSLNLKCLFPNGLRADYLTYKHIKLLKEVALDVNISAESSSKKTLDYLRKSLSHEDIERVAGWCHELGVPLGIHYMIGIPEETPEEANETLSRALEMRDSFGAMPLVQYFVPMPGSSVFEEMRRKGHLYNYDSSEIYTYFTKTPVIDRPDFPASKLLLMMESFRKRLDDTSIKKLIINLTYKCINNCVFCAIGDRDNNHGDFRRYCELLVNYRNLGIDSVDFDGGEPTLFPQFLRIVAFARDIGYRHINVTTNARNLNDRAFASRFLLSGLTSVLVSLHGHTPEIHEWHTRSEGSFLETIGGIEHIKTLKPGRVEFTINTTVTERNAPHADEFFSFVNSFGSKKVNLQFITPHGNAGSFAEYNIRKLADIVSTAVRKWSKTLDINLINLPPCLSWQITGIMKPDTEKYSRVMVFVDTPPMNLGEYLDQKRIRTAECKNCGAAPGCSGFYCFHNSDEA